ncbi:transporter substrate-binding domain-containing protein [Sulfurimonas sp. MAG313]|nr:transporter substrate-binding domain-containing protein [Sulfurimonas sp. MAG313]MDF1880199.1 transporter substrate-binding domain-containing protein [Sulfurimonas sp. MAG313]
MKFLLIIAFITIQLNAQTFSISLGKNSVAHEISKKILIKAYARIGIQPKFISTGFLKSLELANSGKTDGDVSRVKQVSKKYPNLIAVPVEINFIEAVAFSKKHTIKINNWKDLAPYKIVIVKGIKFIEYNTEGFDRVIVANYKEAFDLLHSMKADIIIVPKLVGILNQFKNTQEHIKAISPSLKKLSLYHFVHKKNAYLIPKLVPVLKAMQKSGELQYIRSAYLRQLTK